MSTTKKQDFKITDEIKKIIVKKFNNPKIDENNILFDLYNNKIRASIKGSYLAHLVLLIKLFKKDKKYGK